ncbi:MAG: S24/S26 family peptidase [Thermodesulfovibrionia bacterium]|nr:S24/S26 family peptidase [Thermodesulfovibrionia bacterium]
MLNNAYEHKAVTHWFHFIKEKILREDEVSLQVSTDSMRPFISPLDRVVIKGCRVDDLEPGDIVLFEKNSALHVHRFL